MTELTIVMYHYVRPIIGSDYPAINGLEVESFKKHSRILLELLEQVSWKLAKTLSKASPNLPKTLPKPSHGHT